MTNDHAPQEWEIWHARFDFSEGKGCKYRPVIVVDTCEDGSLVMMVTSAGNKLHLDHDFISFAIGRKPDSRNLPLQESTESPRFLRGIWVLRAILVVWLRMTLRRLLRSLLKSQKVSLSKAKWLLLARTINLQLRRLASSLRLQAWSKSSSRRMTRVSMAVLLPMIWTGKARANRTISVLTRSHACI